MKRTYGSKRNEAILPRDLYCGLSNEPATVFQALSIRNIKKYKHEFSTYSRTYQNTTNVNEEKFKKKKKYVKRISNKSPKTLLTPDKSLHVNKPVDLFDIIKNDGKVSLEKPKKDPFDALLTSKSESSSQSSKYSLRSTCSKNEKSDQRNGSEHSSIFKHYQLNIQKYEDQQKKSDSIQRLIKNTSNFNRLLNNQENSNVKTPSKTKHPVITSTPYFDKHYNMSMYNISPIIEKTTAVSTSQFEAEKQSYNTDSNNSTESNRCKDSSSEDKNHFRALSDGSKQTEFAGFSDVTNRLSDLEKLQLKIKDQLNAIELSSDHSSADIFSDYKDNSNQKESKSKSQHCIVVSAADVHSKNEEELKSDVNFELTNSSSSKTSKDIINVGNRLKPPGSLDNEYKSNFPYVVKDLSYNTIKPYLDETEENLNRRSSVNSGIENFVNSKEPVVLINKISLNTIQTYTKNNYDDTNNKNDTKESIDSFDCMEISSQVDDELLAIKEHGIQVDKSNPSSNKGNSILENKSHETADLDEHVNTCAKLEISSDLEGVSYYNFGRIEYDQPEVIVDNLSLSTIQKYVKTNVKPNAVNNCSSIEISSDTSFSKNKTATDIKTSDSEYITKGKCKHIRNAHNQVNEFDHVDMDKEDSCEFAISLEADDASCCGASENQYYQPQVVVEKLSQSAIQNYLKNNYKERTEKSFSELNQEASMAHDVSSETEDASCNSMKTGCDPVVIVDNLSQSSIDRYLKNNSKENNCSKPENSLNNPLHNSDTPVIIKSSPYAFVTIRERKVVFDASEDELEDEFDEANFAKPRVTEFKLFPGKRWERSLSIYKRLSMAPDMTAIEDLDNSDLALKRGRKCRESIIELRELQKKNSTSQDFRTSAYFEHPKERKSRRMTLRVVINGEVSRISQTRRTTFDDLANNTDNLDEELCDDTILELSRLSLHGDKNKSLCTTINLTSKDIVLQRCNQSSVLPFNQCFTEQILKNCRKIGEGVFGEVFMCRGPDGKARVIKAIPVGGSTVINGETQRNWDEIVAELIIAGELSALRRGLEEDNHAEKAENATDTFNEVLSVRCVYGKYPEQLLDLWDLYNESKGSENDSPDLLPNDQEFVIFELANAGQDLEGFVFNSAEQAYSVFYQVAYGLAVAEEALQFEHRDLHWGNVLIANTEQKYITYLIKGREIKVASRGIKATLIDYSLSRVTVGADTFLFYDLECDEELFGATGDYQFDVYRLMREAVGKVWSKFEPYTNILWLNYTLDKMITALRYKRTNTKIHKQYIATLKEIKGDILRYKSCKEFIENYNFI